MGLCPHISLERILIYTVLVSREYTVYVCGSYVVTCFNWMPKFDEWYLIWARFVVMDGHRIDTCFDGVGLCAQIPYILTKWDSGTLHGKGFVCDSFKEEEEEEEILHFGPSTMFASQI